MNKYFNYKTKQRGLNRQLYFTPLDVIEKVVKNLLFIYPELKIKTWIDPCAADGRWSDIIKKFNIDCLNFDIVPLRDDVIKKDFLKDDFSQFKNYFFIGNPPYKLLDKFVKKALSLTDNCYFLGSGNKIISKLFNNVQILHRFEGFEGNQKDLRSKCRFIDTNNKNVLIWTCGALFNNENNNKFIINKKLENNSFAFSIYKFCDLTDKRIISIKDKYNYI